MAEYFKLKSGDIGRGRLRIIPRDQWPAAKERVRIQARDLRRELRDLELVQDDGLTGDQAAAVGSANAEILSRRERIQRRIDRLDAELAAMRDLL